VPKQLVTNLAAQLLPLARGVSSTKAHGLEVIKGLLRALDLTPVSEERRRLA
jgi:hypothetical protein